MQIHKIHDIKKKKKKKKKKKTLLQGSNLRPSILIDFYGQRTYNYDQIHLQETESVNRNVPSGIIYTCNNLLYLNPGLFQY